MLNPLRRLWEKDTAPSASQPSLPWLIIGGAFAVTAAIIISKESGASDADTDYLSMVILIAAFALASALDRRTGLVVAVLAGIIAAIVPGSTSFTHTHLWDSLFRICFLLAMSMSFYRVIVVLRDREDHLHRQLGNVQRLQEEVTTLHAITARPPINRALVYQQIACAASRLVMGATSRLLVRMQPDDRWQIVARWPPEQEDAAQEDAALATDTARSSPYAITPRSNGGRTISVPLSTGTRVTGLLQLDCAVPQEGLQEYGQLLAVYARDATLTLDHVALQERLEYLAVMGERGRIARDLHDGLVQSLAGIAFHLEYYRDLLTPEATAMRAGLDGMANDVKEALHEARSMIQELRNAPSPERLGAALDDLVNQVAAKSDLSIVTDIFDLAVPITHAQASALLRVAQEAFQNIVTHAHADTASLRLTVAGGQVVLQIADNGCGLARHDAQDTDAPVHFGLVGMAERAAMHGADLSVESRLGQGTTVTLVVPVTAEGMDA